MGHERVGSLPRTRQWRAIVSAIATVDPGDTAQIATIEYNEIICQRLAVAVRFFGLSTTAIVKLACQATPT